MYRSAHRAITSHYPTTRLPAHFRRRAGLPVALGSAFLLLLVVAPAAAAMPSFSPNYVVACTGPSPSVAVPTQIPVSSYSGLSTSASSGLFRFLSQTAGPISPTAGGSITSQESFTVDPSPAGCYQPTSSFSTATATFTFAFSGTMNESITCGTATSADVSMTLFANVYSSASGALFATPPSNLAVSQNINCGAGPTSFTSTINGATVTTGSFAVSSGVKYGFYAEVEIHNDVTTGAGGYGSSGESGFQATLSSVSCAACP